MSRDSSTVPFAVPALVSRVTSLRLRPRHALAALATALLAVLPDAALAATAGGLDPSFDRDGRSLLADMIVPRAVLVQEDGKIVIAGASRLRDFSVVRLKPDGSRDKGFNGDGGASADFGGDDYAYAAALQPDGKILVAGQSSLGAAIARFDADGSLDPTFDPGGPDGDGKKLLPSGGTTYQSAVRSVHVRPDGRIVLAGAGFSNGSSTMTVTRLLPDGAPDRTTFVHASFGSGAYAAAGALAPDGKIVVAGSRDLPDSDHSAIALARFDPDGTLDETFAGTGKVTFDSGVDEFAEAVLVQPDGRVVVAGVSGSLESMAMVATRFSRDGTPDTSFGSDARAGADFDGISVAGAAALRPDGKIVLAGAVVPPYDFAIARLHPNGALDPSFGSGGRTAVDFGDLEAASAIALQPDGRVVVAGQSQVAAVVARLLADPPPPGGGGPGIVGGAGRDPAPRISRLSLTRARFGVSGRRRGTRIRFTLSEPAAVTMTTERATAGRRLRGTCRPARRSNRRARRCTLWRRAGRLRHAGRHGVNSKRFSGRVAGRPLRPGSYRLRLIAVDAANQRSEPRVARFTVLPSHAPPTRLARRTAGVPGITPDHKEGTA